MWIVKIALNRPYTFIVLSLLIALMGAVTIYNMAKDIFPNIGIPVVGVVWSYTGLPPKDVADRIVANFERAATVTVNDIEHTESQALNGVSVTKIFFQPNVNIDLALAQVTAIAQTILRNMPPGTLPPQVLSYNASTVPIVQLALSSKSISEPEMFDLSNNFIRNDIATIPGAAMPYPYGGKSRQVQVDLDQNRMQALGISAQDVNAAIGNQNLILPSGTQKIGEFEYNVRLNGSPTDVAEFNDMPIKAVNGTTVYIRDVAHVRDGFAPQTNIVRMDGARAVLVTILKTGNASTLSILDKLKEMMPTIKGELPAALEVQPIGDQSIFVRAAIDGVVREGVIAAILTGLMILLFLGSWRSTAIIIISIPLSILVSILCLWALGQTINIMTLGGLALAVGILVDDATVAIENINSHLEEGKEVREAILDGAQQIAIPALVSTLCICIVFVPMFRLTGVSYYLFVPLAEAVVFAMLASYLFSRTLVPTLAMYWLKKHGEEDDKERSEPWRIRIQHALEHGFVQGSLIVGIIVMLALTVYFRSDLVALERSIEHKFIKLIIVLGLIGLIVLLLRIRPLLARFQQGFERRYEKTRDRYHGLLERILGKAGLFIIVFLVGVALSLCLWPFLGRDFFPSVDGGQLKLHVRAHTGLRVEEMAKLCDKVDTVIRSVVPDKELSRVVDNIGLPISGTNLTYSNSAPIGSADADIQISFAESHRSIFDYARKLRTELAKEMPGVSFAFLPADMVGQILNFGLPSPIDVQVVGYSQEANRKYTADLFEKLHHVPGLTDLRIQQTLDQPEFRVNVDRTRAQEVGLTQHDVASSMIVSLSGSFQNSPTFWLSSKGVSYNVVTQTPQYSLDSLNALKNILITGGSGSKPQILGALGSVNRGVGPATVSHYNVKPTFDIYASVQDRDLGGVARDINKILKETEKQIPPSSSVVARGQMQTMESSFSGLYEGLLFAIVLVYLLIVVNFQSWTDPFIIITALPGAIAGIVWMLFLTHTTISVPALTGAIMCMGVATANSVLVVSFARERMDDHGDDARTAALAAGSSRLRPVLMTALAMIIGMIPMALGFGEGGEQNAPLGRAVIGGLIFATIATLFFVPAVFKLIHSRMKQTHKPNDDESKDDHPHRRATDKKRATKEQDNDKHKNQDEDHEQHNDPEGQPSHA